MLQLIARQQELSKIKVDCLVNGKSLYEHTALETVQKSGSPFIGKELTVISKKIGDMTEESLSQYRLYEEGMVQLGIHILTAGQIAIGYYK